MNLLIIILNLWTLHLFAMKAPITIIGQGQDVQLDSIAQSIIPMLEYRTRAHTGWTSQPVWIPSGNGYFLQCILTKPFIPRKQSFALRQVFNIMRFGPMGREFVCQADFAARFATAPSPSRLIWLTDGRLRLSRAAPLLLDAVGADRLRVAERLANRLATVWIGLRDMELMKGQDIAQGKRLSSHLTWVTSHHAHLEQSFELANGTEVPLLATLRASYAPMAIKGKFMSLLRTQGQLIVRSKGPHINVDMADVLGRQWAEALAKTLDFGRIERVHLALEQIRLEPGLLAICRESHIASSADREEVSVDNVYFVSQPEDRNGDAVRIFRFTAIFVQDPILDILDLKTGRIEACNL